MKRWASVAFAGLCLLAWIRIRASDPASESGILPIEPPTPFIHWSPEDPGRGRVLLAHGLGGAKEVMSILGKALADAGFEVFAIDLPGHGSSPVRFTATASIEALDRAFLHLGSDTILVGHSMGGALIQELADHRRFKTVILISPAPVPLTRIVADRLLVVVGEWDLPAIRAHVPRIVAEADGDAHLWTLGRTFHTTTIFNPGRIDEIVHWLGGSGPTRTRSRLVWLVVLVLSGILALAFALSYNSANSSNPGPLPAGIGSTHPVILIYMASYAVAVLALRLVVVFRWVNLFTADYLLSFLFVAGVVAALYTRPSLAFSAGGLKIALPAAVWVILILAVGISNVAHTTMDAGRWWRHPILIGIGLPFFLFDEWIRSQARSFWHAAANAVLSRALLWAAVMVGVLFLNRESVYLILIAHLIVAFSMALWLVSDIVFRRTRCPVSSALFASIVQGWVFSTVFVTI